MKALLIRDLYKKYAEGTLALQGISLDVEEGEFFGLLGPNGAGKTTAIGIVCSLVNKGRGYIEVFGYDLEKNSVEAKQQIGLVPQEFNFNVFERSIDILINQAGYYGIPKQEAEGRAEFFLKKLGLWDKAYVPARLLSGGMKRRLMIARGLIHHPKLLILDEPTAGVDIEIRRLVWAFLQEINQQGVTIILTTHNLDEAENLCQQIAIIDKGNIIENTSKKQLIQKLNVETLILDIKHPCTLLPTIPGFMLRQIDDLTLEVDIERVYTLNDLFSELSRHNIEVISLRNKSNRLEELFLHLVAKKGE